MQQSSKVDVKFSTGLPNCREGRLNPVGSVSAQWMRAVATAADELGYYSLWLNEFPETEPSLRNKYATPPSYFDAVVTMADVARGTSSVRFLPSTIVLPQHNPLILCRQLATLDLFTNGRITLGIGLGGAVDQFRRLRGELGQPNRGDMMDEYVQALRTLWADSSATFRGRYVSFEDVEVWPKPAQGQLPIFMAGNADTVTARIARFGDGWIDGSHLPHEISARAAQLSRAADGAGRGATNIEICRQFYISLDIDDERATRNLEASVPAGPPQRRPSSESILSGTSDSIAARLKDYVSAGVTEIAALFFAPTDDHTIWQMEKFMQEVVPQVIEQVPGDRSV